MHWHPWLWCHDDENNVYDDDDDGDISYNCYWFIRWEGYYKDS